MHTPKKNNKMPLYVIVAHLFGNQDKRYLAWQMMPWDNDGYFWTSWQVLEDILKKNPEYNMPQHQFAFAYPEGAYNVMHALKERGVNMYDAKIEKIYT